MARPRTTRQNFLITSMMAAGGVIGNTACQHTRTATTAQVQTSSLSTASAHSISITSSLDIPQRTLVRTEIKVPIFGLGGAGRDRDEGLI